MPFHASEFTTPQPLGLAVVAHLQQAQRIRRAAVFHVLAAGEHHPVAGAEQAGIDQLADAAARRPRAGSGRGCRESIGNTSRISAPADGARRHDARTRRSARWNGSATGSARAAGFRSSPRSRPRRCARTGTSPPIAMTWSARSEVARRTSKSVSRSNWRSGGRGRSAIASTARHRMLASHRFLRQHHRVGAVRSPRSPHPAPRRVGIGLSTIDYQHLRRGDHHLARSSDSDGSLLRARRFRVADLHAEVAARDHHHVAGVVMISPRVGDGLSAFTFATSAASLPPPARRGAPRASSAASRQNDTAMKSRADAPQPPTINLAVAFD